MEPIDVLQVALNFQDKNLFEQYLAKGLNAALGIHSTTYGYRIGLPEENTEAKKLLREFLDKH